MHDEWDDNLFLTTFVDGDVESVKERAAVVVEREYRTARQCMVPLEGKAVLARHDERKGQLVVYTSTQVPHLIRTGLSQFLGLDQADVRVIAPDVGGGFGYKCVLQPEEISVSWAAMRTGRPLRWVEDRREHLTAGANTRQHHYRLTACADGRGRLLAVDALRTIEPACERVTVGAAVTHAEIEDRLVSDVIERAMREVAAGIACRAVRNRGTIGGSVAHADPSADWLIFLLCAGARMHVRGAAGTRVLPATDFIRAAYTTDLAPGEIVTHVEIPRAGGRARFGFCKLCRKAGEFAEAVGAVLIDPERRCCRVVAGAVGPKPVVLPDTTRSLAANAMPPEPGAIRAEIAAVANEHDPVKLHLTAVAVRRAIDRALAA